MYGWGRRERGWLTVWQAAAVVWSIAVCWLAGHLLLHLSSYLLLPNTHTPSSSSLPLPECWHLSHYLWCWQQQPSPAHSLQLPPGPQGAPGDVLVGPLSFTKIYRDLEELSLQEYTRVYWDLKTRICLKEWFYLHLLGNQSQKIVPHSARFSCTLTLQLEHSWPSRQKLTSQLRYSFTSLLRPLQPLPSSPHLSPSINMSVNL